MEENPLNNYLEFNSPETRVGSHRHIIEPWYNESGDCIEFKTVNEEVVADRIDDYLTIYRTVDTNQAVGFKLKDVQALIRTHGADGYAVRVQVTGKTLVHVSALLLIALQSLRQSTNRTAGYAMAVESFKSQDVSTEVEVAAVLHKIHVLLKQHTEWSWL